MNTPSPSKNLPAPTSGATVRRDANAPAITSSANTIIHDFINRMVRQRFYGTISVRFEDGIAVHIRREESLPVGKVGAGYEGVRDE
jgi:hypothetical protein